MTALLRKAYAHSGQAEHLGFVLVAYCDLLEVHKVVVVVTVWLAVTGIPSFIRDCKECR